MEAHLRKITRSLGKAVTELEQVSTSEKVAEKLDAEWMERFHSGIAVPTPLVDAGATKPREAHDACGQDGASEGGTDLRWTFLSTRWLPLLRDLHHTVGVLDQEESALQAAEQAEETAAAAAGHKSAGGEADGDGAPPGSSSSRAAPPRPPKGLLSLRDYTVIHAALEIVVHWGLVPVLEPGVGVFDLDKRPRSRAVKLSRRVLHYWGAGKQQSDHIVVSSQAASAAPGGGAGASAGARSAVGGGGGRSPSAGADGVGGDGRAARAQLALCTGVIQGVVMTGQFMPMLMPLYLPDLLAARLQLVYGQAAVACARAAAAAAAAAAASANTTSSPALPHTGGEDVPKTQATATADCRPPAPLPGDRDPSPAVPATTANGSSRTATGSVSPPLLMSALRAVLKDVGPRHVMGALRHLLSQGARAPPWLRQRAGRILSEIVLRPGGVQATLEVYLAGAGTGSAAAAAGGEGDEIKACLRVAKLLATPPKRVAARDYVARVAPQLAEMLHFDGQQRAIVTRVMVMIIGRLSESMPAETRRLILFPLLRPLLLFWGPRGKLHAPLRPSSRSSLAAKSGPSSATKSKERLRPVSPSALAAAGVPASNEGVGGVASPAAGGPREEADRGGDGGIGGSSVAADDIVSSEEMLGRCLEDLEKLLTAAPAPPALLRELSAMGVPVPLFRLHCFCATAKSRNLQSTKASLAALLPSSTTAASDLVAGLLPDRNSGWGAGVNPRFTPGPTGGTVLRAGVPAAAGGKNAGPHSGGSDAAAPLEADDSLLGMEAALQGLGLDPETLRLVGSAAAAAAAGGGLGGEEGVAGVGAGLMGALAGLKEAEGRARAAADVLEGLGEGSPVAGQVFDMLLRRYLSLRDGEGAPAVAKTAGPPSAAAARGKDRSQSLAPATTAAAASTASAAEQHAVMASVVVLAERLGARVFGTGMQMLSCIRLVLEHEQPRKVADVGEPGNGGDGGYEGVDAAARVAQMEAAVEDDEGGAEGGLGLGVGEAAEGDEDTGDTLCSVVLALLTTILELGEEERTAEEEVELRAMLGPLKALAAGHRSVEVAEMSSLLCASILSRGLTPEERREERERVKAASAGDGGGSGGGEEGEREARTARMLSALDAAEEDLRSEAVPMRARGVVTLTRCVPYARHLDERRWLGDVSSYSAVCVLTPFVFATINDAFRLMRAILGGNTNASNLVSGARVNMDTVVAQRLMDTYARMAGDGDSYVFLAAVQGLAALADALPGWCIPRLVGIFTATSGSGAKGAYGSGADKAAGAGKAAAAAAAAASPAAPLPLSQRLKIGEAVVLSARRCGDAMPKYAHFYVNAFVVAARERSPSRQDTAGASTGGVEAKGAPSSLSSSSPSSLESKERYHFRASCLSNLAEVCQLLRWSLGRFSQDLVGLGVGILSAETGASEEATLARRGASFLLGRVVRGAGEDVLEMVPAAELRSAYRALKRCAEGDSDEITRAHARNGLASLDVAIRGQLFPGGGAAGGRGEAGGGAGDRRRDGGVVAASSTARHPGITVL
ncbi:unnamed protein product [Scytosiphon promiscuus]